MGCDTNCYIFVIVSTVWWLFVIYRILGVYRLKTKLKTITDHRLEEQLHLLCDNQSKAVIYTIRGHSDYAMMFNGQRYRKVGNTCYICNELLEASTRQFVMETCCICFVCYHKEAQRRKVTKFLLVREVTTSFHYLPTDIFTLVVTIIVQCLLMEKGSTFYYNHAITQRYVWNAIKKRETGKNGRL